MKLVFPLEKIREEDRDRVGGKAYRLALMARRGMPVPEAVCLSIESYTRFVCETKLAERINFELNRKSLEEMRWEEIWDAALRIRNLFIHTPMPGELHDTLLDALAGSFAGRAVAVRSSAEAEDREGCSFAGLHESFVNIRGMEEILDHIKLVWASLWSDRALLYRKELGLDIRKSAMAVLVQAVQPGESSGIAFSKSPTGEDHCVIEAVYGFNQGLVDGTVSPDRWTVDRVSGSILDHIPPPEREMMIAVPGGLRKVAVPPDKAEKPPLDRNSVSSVYELTREAEALFNAPQDTEWTLDGKTLHILQSRPITTLKGDGEDDRRPWYLSLHRSFENLKVLWKRIEEEILPSMESEAQDLSKTDLSRLDNPGLAREIEKRQQVYKKWREVYWDDCIPFAHGMRLFGQVYNDKVRPSNPYEFMDLLSGSSLMGLKRNEHLEEIAGLIRQDPGLAECLKANDMYSLDSGLRDRLEKFLSEFGVISRPDAGGYQGEVDRGGVLKLALEMSKNPRMEPRSKSRDVNELEKRFLCRFAEDELDHARELLDLGRASHRLRDDDNLYLEMVEAESLRAVREAGRRIGNRAGVSVEDLPHADVIRCLRDPGYVPEVTGKEVIERPTGYPLKARQLVGQPAGPGWVRGTARVIEDPSTLFKFQNNEILVCDAIDPGMTFVVPLASGIVERRGGMLIHGAIIAREYGLPCVTGVPDATSLIRTGDRVTVDGYLGLVIIG